MRECKKLTVANLVAYMEKEKSNLRRLKRGYWSRKKQHEARQINRQFQLDPRREGYTETSKKWSRLKGTLISPNMIMGFRITGDRTECSPT